jgi:endonuclease/exonuclease/phosphatase family metal-dependent hydrolase
MIEKGLLLEPGPIAFLIVVFSSLVVADWTYWVLLCLSGLIASVFLKIRRTMRMMEVGKLVDKIMEKTGEVNDHMSVKTDFDDEIDNDLDKGEDEYVEEGEKNMKGIPIRILTYNLYLRPPLINSNGNDWKDERLKLFIETVLSKYDVIALQEVFALGSSRQARLIHAAKKLGFKWVVKSVAPPLLTSLKFIDAGLLILSKFPIVEASGHIYASGHQIDHYAAKQVIYAKIAIPNKANSINSSSCQSAKQPTTSTFHQNNHHINVFTTHTQASYYENSEQMNSQNDSARLSQVQELLHFIHQKVYAVPSNAYNPVLILGDLNLDARAGAKDGFKKGREYHILEALFMKQYQSCPTQTFNALKHSTSQQTNIELKAEKVGIFKSGENLHVKDAKGELAVEIVGKNAATTMMETKTMVGRVNREEMARMEEKRKMEPTTFMVRDLILERYGGEHPPTYGDAREDGEGKVVHIQEPVLTNSADWACRLAIDYIFLITRSHQKDDKQAEKGERKRWTTVYPTNTNIQQFLVNPLQNPFFQLSDHYAVETTINIM